MEGFLEFGLKIEMTRAAETFSVSIKTKVDPGSIAAIFGKREATFEQNGKRTDSRHWMKNKHRYYKLLAGLEKENLLRFVEIDSPDNIASGDLQFQLILVALSGYINKIYGVLLQLVAFNDPCLQFDKREPWANYKLSSQSKLINLKGLGSIEVFRLKET